ncbi:MAG: hypothetical protein WBQ94_14530 [Terracidiphilus sp.]
MSMLADQKDRQLGLKHWRHGAIFLVAFAVLVSRRPDAVFHAQFWAEDGQVWYADAYNLGWWPALFRPLHGYFQLLPRLTVSLALIPHLARAPLVLNLVAVAVQALPVNLLLSSRSAGWGSLRYRALLAGVYLALPNCTEVSYGITLSQWQLALVVFLVLVGSTPKAVGGRLIDILIVLLCSLSGPFCIFLFPIALFVAWSRRGLSRWVSAGVLAAVSLLQAWCLLRLDPSGRSHYALGASAAMLARIVAGHIYLGTVLGGNGMATTFGQGFLVCIALLGTAILIACLIKSNMEMKLFLLFSAMVLAASLASPTNNPPPGVSVWADLATVPAARYWFFPTLAFAWSLLWCFHGRVTPLKMLSAPLLFLMCFGIVREWVHPALNDMHFTQYAKQFESVAAGTVVTIPENPEGWEIRLTKRPAGR